MKNINLIKIFIILTLFVSCSSEDSDTPTGNTQTFEEFRAEVDQRLNLMFQSFSTSLIDGRLKNFDDFSGKVITFFYTKNEIPTSPFSNVYETPIGKLYYDFGTTLNNFGTVGSSHSDVKYMQIPSGIYNWNAASKSFARTATTTNTVVINFPIDNSTTNNASLEYSNLELTKSMYTNHLGISKEARLIFGIKELSNFITNGTITLKINTAEKIRLETTSNFNLNMQISPNYDVSVGFDNQEVPYLDAALNNGSMKIYLDSKPLLEYKFNLDGYNFQEIEYDPQENPMSIKYTFSNENTDLNPAAFQPITNYTLIHSCKGLAVSLFCLEKWFTNNPFNSTKNDRFITVQIEKGVDKLVLDLDMSLITTITGETIYNTRYSIIEGVIGGYFNQNNERIFNLVKNGTVLYTNYVYQNTQVNANDYLIPNFNPIENEIENYFDGNYSWLSNF